MSKKYTLTINEKQVLVIAKALDNYTRLKMGQFNIPFDDLFHQIGSDYEEQQINEHLYQIRNIIFPELKKFGLTNGSYGIHNTKVDDKARIAYDIEKVINHKLWLGNPSRIEGVVDSYEPRQAGLEQLPSINQVANIESDI